MLKLFKGNMILQVLLLVGVAILSWWQCLSNPVPMVEPLSGTPVYNLFHSALHSVPLLATILGLILVLVEGVLFNVMLAQMRLVPQTTLLPAMLYVACMSSPAAGLSPMVLVNGVMIPCAWQLMLHSTLLSIPRSKISSAAAMIGICTLI